MRKSKVFALFAGFIFLTLTSLSSAKPLQEAIEPYIQILQGNKSPLGYAIPLIHTNSQYKDRYLSFLHINYSSELQRHFVGRGGEGRVYRKQNRSSLAIKRWTHKNFVNSVATHLYFYNELYDRFPSLRKYFDIAYVYEMGTDYIIRDFFEKSIPISKSMATDQRAYETYEVLLSELFYLALFDENNPFLEELTKKFQKASANLHWDPQQEKIVLIDAL